MSFETEIRDTLKSIDVKPYAQENHGGASYVSWSKVWALILDHYPASPWPEFKEEYIGNGDVTCMVHCTLTIKGEDGAITKSMHLPVMESYGQFKAIVNPDARDISDTRMRCFVKCAGVFGLGLSMWSGEDYDKANKDLERILAFTKKKSDYRMALWKTAICIKDAFIEDDATSAYEAWSECDEGEKKDLWLAETKGGFFTQKEKSWLQAAALEAMQPKESE